MGQFVINEDQKTKKGIVYRLYMYDSSGFNLYNCPTCSFYSPYSKLIVRLIYGLLN